MIRRSEIREYVKTLVREFAPQRVVLFGSFANGAPTEDSDVDLLVIMNHKKRKNVDQVIGIRMKMDAPFPMDLLVKRPAEVRQRLALGDMFLRSILDDGKTLYDRKG